MRNARSLFTVVALAVVTLVTALLVSASARADTNADSNGTLFAGGVEALGRGAFDDAIDRFELLADRGFSHPDASYDRAVAYVRRAESHGARAGDLGRAAAALSETLLLRPDDADAAFALDRVHEEVARRRARAHASEIDLKPSLGWAVVGLFSEDTWALLAAIGAVALSLGLALGFLGRTSAMKLSAIVVASLGAVLLVVAGSLGALSRHDRLHAHPAVVIAEEARLLDDNGAPVIGQGTLVPEGASVRVVEERGALAKVEWGTLDGWLSLGQIRILARP